MTNEERYRKSSFLQEDLDVRLQFPGDPKKQFQLDSHDNLLRPQNLGNAYVGALVHVYKSELKNHIMMTILLKNYINFIIFRPIAGGQPSSLYGSDGTIS